MKHMKIRKGISLLLALCLCLGMLSTPALAAPGYPDGNTGNTGTADSEKLDALKETVYVYLNVGEGTVTDEEVPEMPEFQAPDASVEEEVKKAQEALDSADKPADFTETPPEAVDDAPDFSGDLEAAKDAMAEAEKNLNSAKDNLDTRRDALTSTLAEAEEAAKSANEAIESAKAEQEKLQGELDEALGQLEAPADEDKPGAMEDYGTYEEYTAAVDAYNAKVDAYNAACGQLKEKYEQARTELQGKADAAAQAKESADTKVQEAQDALDAFNTAVDSYNELGKEPPKAVTDYNQALEDYSGEVEEYNEAADEYNKAVDEYNTAASEYNQRQDVTDYNGKVDAYKDSVVEYDEKALAWNNDKADKNDEAVIGALLGESGSLLDSKYADQEITVTKEQTAIFDQINRGSIASDALTQEQVDAYNSVVKAYNAAVDQYNANAKKDLIGLLKEDSRFDTQNGSYNAGTDTEVNLWYTIGKVDVGNVFQDNPGTIKQDSAGTDSGTDYSSQDGGRDVYYWDKKDGKWTMNAAGSNAAANFESHLNGDLDDLQTAMGSSGNLEYFQKDAGSSASKVDLSGVTSKWVLKVSNGANGYQSETSVNGKLQPSWHLDGYLKVTKLAKLTELAAVPVKNDYSNADRVEAKTVETLKTLPSVDESSIEWTAKSETAVSWEGITVEGPGAIELKEPDIPLAAEPIVPDEQPVIPDPDPVIPEPDPVVPEPDPMVPEPVDPVVPVDPVEPAPPAVDIPEVDVPLVETPEEIPAVVEIPEELAPLAETPEEIPAVVEIIDDGVPLADVPKTGDISAVWYLSALLSAAGLLVLTGLERRRSRAK